MENLEKINFRQVRDFGETFNVSVKFIKQNFKLFFQSLIFIAGPFILISSIAGAFYQSHSLTTVSVGHMGFRETMESNLGWLYFIFMAATMVSGLTLSAKIFSFMINYTEKGPGNFTVNDVSKTLIKNTGNVLSVFFTTTFLLILIVCVIVVITYVLIKSLPVLGVLLMIALFFGLLIIVPPLSWQLASIYLVKMQENKSLSESFSRTREVMRGNFWGTWLLMVCGLFVVMILAGAFKMPEIIFQLVLALSHKKSMVQETSVPFLIIATVCTFCSLLIYSCFYVISTFHYFSLAEKKDGIGLMDRINEIGNAPNDNVEQQY
jgi:hypothetical protein